MVPTSAYYGCCNVLDCGVCSLFGIDIPTLRPARSAFFVRVTLRFSISPTVLLMARSSSAIIVVGSRASGQNSCPKRIVLVCPVVIQILSAEGTTNSAAKFCAAPFTLMVAFSGVCLLARKVRLGLDQPSWLNLTSYTVTVQFRSALIQSCCLKLEHLSIFEIPRVCISCMGRLQELETVRCNLSTEGLVLLFRYFSILSRK
jgi:hypothetical protein